MAKPWKSPYYEGRSPWTSDDCLHGLDMSKAAANWIEKHPTSFNELFREVKKYQGMGRVPYLRDRVKLAASERGITVKDGDYTFANGLWAVLVRYMCLADASLVGDPVIFEKSCVDTSGLVPIDARLTFMGRTYTLEKEQEWR